VRFASTAASKELHSVLNQEIDAIKRAGTYKRERVITSSQSSHIYVAERPSSDVINFCANNYLGLANDRRLIDAAKKVMDSHGLGLSSVRFICGTQNIHKNLEKRIAGFHRMEDSVLYGSAFDANGGLFEALLSKDDAIISDELNHASIIDGIRLSKAQRFRYKHLDMADLETQLRESKSARMRLIASDGVFSMDGHVAPLRQVCDLADKYNALVMIDECHATGFFGPTGRGTDEYSGVRGRVDIINSTLGKAMGGATGGYTAASALVCDMLRQRSRPYLFSNTLAPAVVGASLACFELIDKEQSLLAKLVSNTQRFRQKMKQNKFDIGGNDDHPIVPVMLYDARLATTFADEMLKNGIYVIGFSFPVVPKDQARIRVQISAAHSTGDIDKCVAAFTKVRDSKTKTSK